MPRVEQPRCTTVTTVNGRNLGSGSVNLLVLGVFEFCVLEIIFFIISHLKTCMLNELCRKFSNENI